MSIETRCYHCDLPVTSNTDYSIIIDKLSRPMCCPGCQAVAKTIVDSGLIDYYHFRSKPANRPDDDLPNLLKKLELFDDDEIQKNFVRSETIDGVKSAQATLLISGITCAACSWLIERQIKKIIGVLDIHVNLTTHQATMLWDKSAVKLSQLLKNFSELGYKAQPFQAHQQEAYQKEEFRSSMKRLGLAGFGMMQVMSFALALYLGAFNGIAPEYKEFFRWVSFIVATPVFFYSGRPFFTSAWRGLKTKMLGMDLPISIAIGSAYFISVFATLSSQGEIYFDSVCMFIFFLTLGRVLEMLARHRSIRASLHLQDTTPQSAIRLIDGESDKGKEEIIPAYKLAVGDSVLIKPGEIVPADGLVIEGCSAVSEAILTGESLPLRKKIGDELVGGSQNRESPLIMSVTHSIDNGVLSQIIKLFQNAQREKPPIVHFTNRIAGWFVGFVLTLTLVVGLYWFHVDPSRAFSVMLSLLVITCPCALSLATPTALTACHNRLTKLGVLITRSHVIEGLRSATDMVFDKTGTLTEGEFSIVGVKPNVKNNMEIISIAAGLESQSEHPVAKAFIRYAQETKSKIQSAEQVVNSINRGMEGVIHGKKYRIGKADYVAEIFKNKNNTEEKAIPQQPDKNGLWILLGDTNGPLGWFKLMDKPRENLSSTLSGIKKLGLRITLLTGDASNAPAELAEKMGISHFISDASPEKKMEIIKKMQQEGRKVVMVGDGINDAPVLAAAQTSIAMGTASTFAKTNADAILFGDDLSSLIPAIKITRKSASIIKQNISWAVFYNLLALPLAATGSVEPYWAALGMSVSSLLVVLNALRLSKV